ncbi:MAG TPA: hypothetical protein VF041_09725 [Gemmatimonadaceae bacterium]
MHQRLSLALLGAILLGCASGGAATGATGAAAAAAPSAPLDLAYRIAMPDTLGHLYRVGLDIGGVRDEALELQMPVWSPGRYARMDFARNVRGFSASRDDGRPVRVERVSGSRWRLHPDGARTIHVRYTVFADDLSGTFSVLDTAHANWNGASLFAYVVSHKADPVRLTIEPPDGWHIINGDATAPDQREYRFENYDRLIDTPTEVARAFDVDSFRVDDRLYRVMLHHNGPEHGQRARLVRGVERIVRYENRVFGPPPLSMYTFLFNVGYPGSDGMEHLYSTQIQVPEPFTDDTASVLPALEDAAHEYFHVWNVKRVRPAALGPFDYTAEQYEPSLWVAEGWTQYYGEIGLLRAGVVDTAAYYQTLSREITANLEAPGRKEVSARMASMLAPFWDGAATPMKTDRRNSFFTYYFKGSGIALLLDLQIRARTKNARSLDDALRNLKHLSWDAPKASYYLQGRGYTEQDVERAVSEAMGTDVHDWFERYVGGVEDPPFAETLRLAGLSLTASGEGASRRWTVADMPDATPDQLRVRSGWLTGTTTAEEGAP